MAFSIPIALCIFNRPEPLQQVFAELRRLQPRVLYVFCDGPRPTHPTDVERIRASQAIIKTIDWDCDLRTDYADRNMGCKRRIASGISWAFEHTDRLIILEDDCLPNPSFFTYCRSLLDQYQDDPRVMAISGDNFQTRPRTEFSYYFSKFPHCWGWATWKHAWQMLDLDLKAWPERREQKWLEQIIDVPDELECWRRIFDLQEAGKIDSWAFPWMFSCWMHRGLTVIPERNLVSNIGFSAGATHTTQVSALANLPTYNLGSLRHPPGVERHRQADICSFYKLFYEPRQYSKLRHRLRDQLRIYQHWLRWQYQRKSA